MKYLSSELPTLSNRLLRVVTLVGLGNFGTFLLASYALGGDALNGRAGELGNHGHYVPVGALTYWFSYLHGISIFVSIPLGALAAQTLERRRDEFMHRWASPLAWGLGTAGVAGCFAWQWFDLRPLIGVPVALAAGILACVMARGDEQTRPS